MAKRIINSEITATNVNPANSESDTDNTAKLAVETTERTIEEKAVETAPQQIEKHFYMSHSILQILKVKGQMSISSLLTHLMAVGYERIDSKKFLHLTSQIVKWQFAVFTKSRQLVLVCAPETTFEQIVKDYNIAWAADMRLRNGKELKTIRKEIKPKMSSAEKFARLSFDLENELAALANELESESELAAK